jgi:hypothetical protein
MHHSVECQSILAVVIVFIYLFLLFRKSELLLPLPNMPIQDILNPQGKAP